MLIEFWQSPCEEQLFKQRCSALLPNITMTMIWLNSNQLNCLVLYHFRKNSNYVHGQCSFTILTIYLVACYQDALVCFYQISILRHMHRGDAPTNKETAVGWRLDWKFTGFFLIGSTILFSFSRNKQHRSKLKPQDALQSATCLPAKTAIKHSELDGSSML